MQEVKKRFLSVALILLVTAFSFTGGASVCMASEPEAQEDTQAVDTEQSEESGPDEASDLSLVYKDKESGKTLIVTDDAGLFSDEEIQGFIESAAGLLKHANVIVATAREQDYKGYCKRLISESFGSGSDSTVFLINMDPRQIYLYSEGKVKDVITQQKALSITDNIYRQAKLGAYYECAAKALKQEATLLSGGHILEPMVYIGNFFLAFALAILLTFALTFALLPNEKHEVIAGINEVVLAAMVSEVAFSLINEERIYDPVKSSGSSGDGGGGFSGGGGGGAGGGHSF